MMTIRDVARVAGVSVATVSRVLNHSPLVSAETREAVMRAVTQLDYHPNANAQALATQVSDTIGVVVMDVSDRSLFWRAGEGRGRRGAPPSQICSYWQQLS